MSVESGHRVSNRELTLKALEDLEQDVRKSSLTELEAEKIGDYLVQHSSLGAEYHATAQMVREEGLNLLNGKPESIQKLAGGLMRLHFTDQELGN